MAEQLGSLFIGHVSMLGESEDSLPQIVMREGEKSVESPVHVRGELHFDGVVEDGRVTVGNWHRIALYGSRVMPSDTGRLGIFSLAGPAGPDLLTAPPVPVGSGTRLKLHYAALSTTPELRKRAVDSREAQDGVVFPVVEGIHSRLRLMDGPTDEIVSGNAVRLREDDSIRLRVNVLANDPFRTSLGLVATVALSVDVVFQRAGTSRANLRTASRAAGNFFAPECLSSADPCPVGQMTSTGYILRAKFINLSTWSLADLMIPLEAQVETACRLWRIQAAFDLQVDQLVADQTVLSANVGPDISGVVEANMLRPAIINAPMPIYLVDSLQLDEDCGGGGTVDAGEASAFCILVAGALAENPRLLSHELGHVLGLGHPSGPQSCRGAIRSVMRGITPNLDRNTRKNCRILFPQFALQSELPVATLNPRISANPTNVADCLRPDEWD